VRAFESEFDHVHRTLRLRGVPPADIEDLAQEVFIVMWRRWADFDASRGLRAWLDGIAFNVVGNHLRRRRRADVPDGELDPIDPSPHGEDILAATRAKRAVLRAMEALPAAYRTVLARHDVDGVPMRAIAEQQGVPLFTAYTRLRKARRDFGALVRAELKGSSRSAFLPLFARIGLAVLALAGLALVLVPRRTGPVAAGALGQGLAGAWRFDETAGVVAHDSSGQGRDCYLRTSNAAGAWRPGRLGGAVELGGHDFLECPQPALDEATATQMTVATWALVRSIPATGNNALVTRQLGRGASDHFFLGFSNGRLVLRSHTWGLAIFARALADGGWHHIAFTISATEATLYRDGKALATKPIQRVRRQVVDAPILIGGGSNRPGVVRERMDGAVDETVLYARALSPREIGALAAGAQPANR
jgi:RNA polymerase sigma factor (sigma-70 family)